MVRRNTTKDRAGPTCRGLDLHVVDGLHQAGGGHEECGVAHAARRGDDLAATTRERLGRDLGPQDLELDVADGLVA